MCQFHFTFKYKFYSKRIFIVITCRTGVDSTATSSWFRKISEIESTFLKQPSTNHVLNRSCDQETFAMQADNTILRLQIANRQKYMEKRERFSTISVFPYKNNAFFRLWKSRMQSAFCITISTFLARIPS